MSVIVLRNPFGYFQPCRPIMERHFTLDPEEFFTPVIPHRSKCCPLRSHRCCSELKNNTDLEVFSDNEKFQVNLDVQQLFKPEEISVKVSKNAITIEGKHEEKEDEHGYSSRYFVRKYALPKNCDMEKIESRMSSDGILTITAPKLQIDEDKERIIPVIQTTETLKAQEEKKEDGTTKEDVDKMQE